MAEEYVITPGGLRRKSTLIPIPAGHRVDGSGGRFRELDGASSLVKDHGPIRPRPSGRPLMPDNVVRPAGVPGGKGSELGDGWITYAGWFNATGSPITSLVTTWVVPPMPESDDGQIIFIFNGIQSASMILQPVLSWGSNGESGGDFWSVTSYYADGEEGPVFMSSSTRVEVGQQLTAVINMTDSLRDAYSYVCAFQGITDSILAVTNVEELQWCAQTLECYLLQGCTDYPDANAVMMAGIEVVTTAGRPSITWQPETPITDCGQKTVVVSNANPGGVVGLYFNAYIIDQQVISEITQSTPSIATFDGALYLAWAGSVAGNLNITTSTDSDIAWIKPYVSTESSPAAPALCEVLSTRFIAWADHNQILNVAQISLDDIGIAGLTNKVTIFGPRSSQSPVMATVGGYLYLAWVDSDSNKLNLMVSIDNGQHFGNQYTSDQTSTQAPSLCVLGNSLFIAWTGAGGRLNLGAVGLSGTSITGFTGHLIVEETSGVGPAIVGFNDNLYLSWCGEGNIDLNIANAPAFGFPFGNKVTSSEQSPQPPSMCVRDGILYIAWMGTEPPYVNVARIYG